MGQWGGARGVGGAVEGDKWEGGQEDGWNRWVGQWGTGGGGGGGVVEGDQWEGGQLWGTGRGRGGGQLGGTGGGDSIVLP